MNKKILLTSFDIWLSHHKSNSSDDLLLEIDQLNLSPLLTLLRKLPVDQDQASSLAITKIVELQPDIIICCGMAELRTKLSVESQASSDQELIKTSLNLGELVTDLKITQISNNAGKFVCEGLYFNVLKYLQDQQMKSHCLFIHVPLLTGDNLPPILSDFIKIMDRMQKLQNQP